LGVLDIDVRFAASHDVEIREACADLELHLCAGEVHDICRGLIGHAQNVGMIQLNFRASAVACRNVVSADDWRVQSGCNPFTGIAVLRRDITSECS